MADSLRFVLDFAAKTAGLKDAAALADLLGDELDDTTDAGKAMAAALAAAAAKAEKDLADTVEMANGSWGNTVWAEPGNAALAPSSADS